ncbi:MAG TPA: N-acetylmuramoyl-L-alanine amidase [Longimicrobiales bacterium]|nr:N-acetylmuramoyl-L-alanine amidase [Longimicrobiales bacterium]
MRRLVGVVLGAALFAGPVLAQERPSLRVSDGRTDRLVSIATSRGWLALDVDELSNLGWSVRPGPAGATLDGPGGCRVDVRDGSPFVLWDGAPLQLVDVPYFDGGRLLVPLQLVSDLLPWRLPDVYAFDGPSHTLRVTREEAGGAPPAVVADGVPASARDVPGGSVTVVSAPVAAAARSPVRGSDGSPPEPERASAAPDVRMVFIDAGHGGADPGSISKSGVREKTVALGVARAMAKALEDHAGLEVHLLRDDDTFVPLWDRGARATEMKGETPGVFVSIHANSFTNSARGFETYFLSDARTEHERRVAAIENTPIALEDGSQPAGEDLDFILRELRNLDTSHWSSLLAEMVQTEVAKVHPGPNRGVKQAPLAVITNSLMPSVLVEVGYLSHPDEARLLAKPEFQEQTGRAIADAVLRFFERYPPGSGGGVGEGP